MRAPHSPKRSLAGQYFEISIDNTRFIGYPVLLNDPDKKAPKVHCPRAPCSFAGAASMSLLAGAHNQWCVTRQVNVLKLSALRHNSQRRNSVGGEIEGGAIQDELTTFNIIFVVTEEEAQRVCHRSPNASQRAIGDPTIPLFALLT
jgi:hypothetical protein